MYFCKLVAAFQVHGDGGDGAMVYMTELPQAAWIHDQGKRFYNYTSVSHILKHSKFLKIYISKLGKYLKITQNR
jgi:hypothetical protein